MHKKFIIVAAIGIAVFAGGFYVYTNILSQDTAAPESGAAATKSKVEFQSVSINGTKTSEANADKRPVAVVIDNSTTARPQSGLGDAEIVYETLVEGGVTRYLALFQSRDVAKIGPVRSARPYFAHLASDWQALFAHVGGSDEALAEIAKGSYPGLIDMNQFYRDSYFERTKDKPAPFNVYTSTSKLYDFLGLQGKSTAQRRTLFNFKEDQSPLLDAGGNTAVLVPARTIAIDFSLPAFKVDYTYDALRNVYTRNLGGKAHVDAATDKPIEAKTVVIQYADIVPIPKDKLARVTISLVSSGNALIFMDGKALEGKWKKSQHGRTLFTDYDGKELHINRGPIWVEIVPAGKEKVVTFDGAIVNPDGTVKKEGSLQ